MTHRTYWFDGLELEPNTPEYREKEWMLKCDELQDAMHANVEKIMAESAVGNQAISDRAMRESRERMQNLFHKDTCLRLTSAITNAEYYITKDYVTGGLRDMHARNAADKKEKLAKLEELHNKYVAETDEQKKNEIIQEYNDVKKSTM